MEYLDREHFSWMCAPAIFHSLKGCVLRRGSGTNRDLSGHELSVAEKEWLYDEVLGKNPKHNFPCSTRKGLKRRFKSVRRLLLTQHDFVHALWALSSEVSPPGYWACNQGDNSNSRSKCSRQPKYRNRYAVAEDVAKRHHGLEWTEEMQLRDVDCRCKKCRHWYQRGG